MSEEKDFREMGYPYTVPMNFVYANGHIYFHSALEGHKIDAVRSSPNACFTIINEPVKEENERTAKLRHLGQKYFPDGYDLNADLM